MGSEEGAEAGFAKLTEILRNHSEGYFSILSCRYLVDWGFGWTRECSIFFGREHVLWLKLHSQKWWFSSEAFIIGANWSLKAKDRRSL